MRLFLIHLFLTGISDYHNMLVLQQKKGDEDTNKKSKNGEVGSGRVIPLKQVHYCVVFDTDPCG